MNKITNILHLMRPSQWVKNSFVLLPLFLSGHLSDAQSVVGALVAFVIFCLTSSAIYSINDAVDAPYDAVNPQKCHRPVASGALTPGEAIGVGVLLLFIVASVLIFAGIGYIRNLWLPLGSYLILNIAYSFYLKRIIVLDVLLISLFFVFRIWAGAIASGVQLTDWTIALVGLLALMLAVGKRRYELQLALKDNIVSRANLHHYSLRFLNVFALIVGVATVAVYFLWTISPYSQHRYHHIGLAYTTIFVILGIQRYLWLLFKDNKGGNPTAILLNDRLVQLYILLWAIAVGYIIYCA